MQRTALQNRTLDLLRTFKVVALLGPRQSGKTTLARQIAAALPDFSAERNYFDLEDPAHLDRLENPKLALGGLRGLVIIDEIQRRPELFPVLRVLADRPGNPARFLILGSASRDLIRQGSETLAGRIGFVSVTPFTLAEVGVAEVEKLWLRGGFPLSFLAASDADSAQWREFYIRTFLERDIPALGIQIPALALRRFWMMLAHCHGQVFNASDLGRSLNVADTTVKRYLDVLTGTLMVRRLAPWFENISKRQVKTPKIYFRDSGLLHRLAGVNDAGQLHTWPRLGASWEGFALEEIIRLADASEEEAYFWGVHSQGELDLLIIKDGRRLGFEFKFADSPRLTPACRMALDCLKLDQLTLVYPGDAAHELETRVLVRGLSHIVAKGWVLS
ncbi:MAG: ATP-binding protein [Limisphaerales bacterium]